jgi:hypothetical protein
MSERRKAVDDAEVRFYNMQIEEVKLHLQQQSKWRHQQVAAQLVSRWQRQIRSKVQQPLLAIMPVMQEGISAEAQQLQALLNKVLLGAAKVLLPTSLLGAATVILHRAVTLRVATLLLHTPVTMILLLEATVVAIVIEFNKVNNIYNEL